MRRGSIEASAEIAARPVVSYAILADYCHEHPHILPKPYFAELKVEHGGVGAGTLIRLHMRIFGRVLVETALNTESVTTFKVTPADGRHQARVQITREWPGRPSITGWIERVMPGRRLRSVYTKQLQQLPAYVTSERGSMSSA